jgi:hypothetical protein
MPSLFERRPINSFFYARRFSLPICHDRESVRLIFASVNCDCDLPGLRSAVGERKQWSADEETAGTKSERNAAAEPQTEARRCCGQSIAARDERAVLRRGTGVVERVTGRRAARGAQQSARWSRRKGSLCDAPVFNVCSENASSQTKVLTPASPFMNMIYAITETSWITEQRHSKRN